METELLMLNITLIQCWDWDFVIPWIETGIVYLDTEFSWNLYNILYLYGTLEFKTRRNAQRKIKRVEKEFSFYRKILEWAKAEDVTLKFRINLQ